jgi:hypothetical protein
VAVVNILVESNIFCDIADEINLYVDDLRNRGYDIKIYPIRRNMSVADMKEWLRDHYPFDGLVLVGNIVAPWFKIEAETFPCDLFYMMPMSDWIDVDGDGIFERVENEQVTNWVGRIKVPTTVNESGMLNDYFKRVREYRITQRLRNAVSFVDDDWSYLTDYGLSFAFDDVRIINNVSESTLETYKEVLKAPTQWLHASIHSTPSSHVIREAKGNVYLRYDYLRDNPSQVRFYEVFGCNAGRFTSGNYIAGWYMFDALGIGRCKGLGGIFSTKIGGMFFPERFYRLLPGKTLGDAYLEWWKGFTNHSASMRTWTYGLVLLGDPTLLCS